MKKYYFEADKKQWEKPTESNYVFCPTAKTWAMADSEEEARAIALKKLAADYAGTGTLLDEPNLRLTQTADLPTDWNYGYGSDRGTGTPQQREDLIRECTK